MKTNLIFGMDENFVMPGAVSIVSCLRHTEQDAEFDLRLVDGGLSKHSKDRVNQVLTHEIGNKNISVGWVTLDASIQPNTDNYLFHNTNFNNSVFLRYALVEIVTDDCEQAIYLDSDIVAKTDVLPLLEELSDHPLVAIRDYTIPDFEQRFKNKTLPDWLSSCKGSRYFNSGVFATNVDYWRQHDIGATLCGMIEQYPDTCRWPGQDPMNFTFANKWHETDLGWNLQSGAPDRLARLGVDEKDFLGEPYASIRERAKIVHFTGNKPWNQGFTNPDRPTWFRELEASGWFSTTELYRWKAAWWSNLARRAGSKALSRIGLS